MTNDKAFSIIQEQKENIKNLRKREEQMKFGFDLFKINYGTSPDLEFLEKEISNLEEVWNTKEEWDRYYEKVQNIAFKTADLDTLDDDADDYMRKINQQWSQVMKKWEIVVFLKNYIEQFRSTLPLIKMLREPYMRERHWEKLQRNLGGATLDPTNESFILKEIFDVNIV